MDKTVLIVGGCGFVGYNLALHLNSTGYHVVVADNLVRRGSEVSLRNLRTKGIEFIHCDIRCKEDIANLPKADVVLNCAAQPSAINYLNPEFDVTNNTNGLLNLLEWCRANDSGIIQWSTNKVYSGDLVNSIPVEEKNDRLFWSETHQGPEGWSLKGFNENLSIDGNTHSIYGASKVASDILVQEWANAFNMPAIVNRFSCLAGPNQWGKAEQGWVTWFAIANELELPIDIYGFTGKQVRDCLFTDDINDLISKQIESISNYKGEVFNVGGGVDVSVSLLEAISLLVMKNKRFRMVNHVKDGERRADQRIYISDISKVSNEFNWKPKVTIEEGYDKIMKWVKENKEQLKEMYQ
tara:strand:+ start:2269 stop:3327 length:1059 start_codon:yes stop_codon:yes gene_type:complete